MTNPIYSFLCLALLTLLTLNQPQSTIMTYVIQHQIDQADNFVEITLSVQSEGNRLTKAIVDAEQIINNIQQIATTHCQSTSKSKRLNKQCSGIVQVTPYQIEPKYHLVRKTPTFNLFIVIHQVTIQIRNIEGIGAMIDTMLAQSKGLITLHQFEWKATYEKDTEKEALRSGVQEGKQLCIRMGKVLQDIVSVEEVQVNDQQQKDEQRDADLAQEHVELVIFKFKVRCVNKKK